MAGLLGLLRLLLLVGLGLLALRLIRRLLGTRSRPHTPPAAASRLEQCPVCRDYITTTSSHCGKLHCPRAARPMAIWFFLCLMFMTPAAAHAESGGRYLAELTGSNVTAALVLNDLTVQRWHLSEEASAGASLNHWLKSGSNSLRVVVEPIRPERPVRLKLRVYFLSLATGQQTNLLEITDPERAKKAGITVSFNLASAPALALWQARPADLMAPAQAMELVGEVRSQMIQTLERGGVMADVPAFAIEQADLARAFGATATSGPLVQEGQKPQDRLEVSRLPAVGELGVEAVGSNGLVRIARRDSLPLVALRQRHPDQAVSVSALIVGQVGGRWQVLRRAY